ncbi:MAG: tetratricopeptide repeat protein [Rhodospirillales bacterium]|nr:tetratricopeptide repeat protein [Alphaproteobacteria bacterium]MBL6948573.1 tetratricopeptide repeat protein [Rhodospirillales bacterium]
MNIKLSVSVFLFAVIVLANFAGPSAFAQETRKSIKSVKENVSQVKRLNAFVNDLLTIHRHRVETRKIRKTERVGGYANAPGHYKDIEYFDAGNGRLLSRIRWENKPAGLPEMIEVYFYDKQGKLRVDYLAIFLPGHRNAPFSALINVHYRDQSLAAFRQFDLFGDTLFERCQGEHFGDKVDLWLDEIDIPPSPEEVSEDLYLSCFGYLPRFAGEYENPTSLVPVLKKASAPADDGEMSQTGLESQIADFSQKIQVQSKDANLYAKRGQAYFMLRDFDKAIDDFTKAISLNDNLDAAYFGRGMAYGRNRELDRGIADLSVYIRRNPESSLAYTKRGVRYIWKKDFKSARNDLKMAISLDSSNAEAHDDLGVALAQLGKPEEAVSHFIQSKTLDPSYQKAHHNLAMILYLAGDLERALPAANDALRLQPGNRGSLMLKSAILDGLGQKQEAQAIKERAEFLPEGNWSERSALR